MDVTCERCGTAYEFDDALVSERGTTVKCTSCGNQFKVRRPQPAGAPERWLVRTIDGRELEFRALRELQAAIAQSLITRDDVLSRGGSRPRRLGSIAELEPFFVSAGAVVQHPTNLGLGPKAPPRTRLPTPAGLGVVPPRPEVSVAIPLPRGPVVDPPSVDEETAVFQGPPPAIANRRPASIPPPPRRSVPPAPPGVVVTPSGAPPVRAAATDGEATVGGSYTEVTRGAAHDATMPAYYNDATRVAPDQARAAAAEISRTHLSDPASTPAPVRALRDDVSAPTAPFAVGAVLNPVTVRALAKDDWNQPPPSHPEPSPAPSRPDAPTSRPSTPISSIPDGSGVSPLTPTPAPSRSSYGGDEAYGEPRFSIVASQRRTGAARWMVGLFIGGMVALAFATVGRKLLVSSATAPASEADARVGALLTDGEKSLLEGDLEQAKEAFDKASALAERDARVVADLARLAAAKADVDWLRARLLPAEDPEQGAVRRELEQSVQRARRAADRAAAVAPTDPSVTRSRIDALRLGGDLEGARKLVGAIAASSSQPDNALTLAELDLAEARPDWSTVLGRLRTAVGGEGSLGRARAMLVYALARSGDLAGAKSEIERLRGLPRPHPLVGALTSFVARSEKTFDVSALPDASSKADGGKPTPSAIPSAAPVAPTTHEPRERPSAPEPRERPSAPIERPSTPEPPASPPNGAIDTSDLPGVKAPPAPPPTGNAPPPTPTTPPTPPTPPPANTVPPGVDTSDLPGFK
jgi:predicted Zn finger-like uncharacterized protein